MSNDALNRIRQKKRPAVPPREDQIESRNQPTETTSNQESNLTDNQSTKVDLSQDAKTSRYQDLKTKASTLRLEESIATDLAFLCKREGISREVLVEAMFLCCQKDPSVWESVLKEAHARHEQRQYISNRKRAQSMIERFAEDE